MQVVTDESTFDRLTQRADDALVIAYFWGPDCPNCEVFAADVPGLLPDLPPGAQVLKINAYEQPELARRFGLFGVPAFVLFKGGRKLGMMRQYYGKQYFLDVAREQASGVGASVPG